ncbi:unnamed protein product [Auanema sp. JU1783]|nr:unnamed protein product [Auanema sp. JU1783]
MESQGVSTNYPRTRPRRFVSVLKDITPTTQNLVETNARSRRLSGSLIAAPPLSKAIEKKKESTEEQQKYHI